jgi:predicted ArsR family transcriptional regulator
MSHPTNGLGATRRQVLDRLREAGDSTGAVDVAQAVGLHPNGARFHLEALVEAGLATRSVEDRSSRGRPKVLYTARPATGSEVDGYKELAEVLVDALAGPAGELPSGRSVAEEAGIARGRRLASELRSSSSSSLDPTDHSVAPTPAEATEAVVDALARLGFDSRAVSSRTGRRIDITPCPFLDLARRHPEIVCVVHRGLMTGVLEGTGAPLEVADLEPFARPGRCVAQLRSA